jgi:hypothetical protein
MPLVKIWQRAAMPAGEAAASHLPHTYLSRTQVAARSDMHKNSRDQVRLQNFNMQRKVASTLRAIRMSRKLIFALAQHYIPRVHQLLAAQLRDCRSIPAILDKLAMAVEGSYAAKVCVPIH